MAYRWVAFMELLVAGGLGLLPFAARAGAKGGASATSRPEFHKPDFAKEIQPLFSQYCYGCHGEKKKGDLDLRVYVDESSALRDRPIFEKVLAKLQAHEMPPENKPQPTPAQRQLLTNWVTLCFFQCDCEHPDPGRVTIRRLNRVEYNNTIRDLVGVDFQPAADFPADDSGYGFDNIGDVLSVSPVLMEKYLNAAERILNDALGTNGTNGASENVQASAACQRIMICAPKPAKKLECARQTISHFATRAFRRPVSAEELERLLGFFNSADAAGESFDDGIKLTLEAVLLSPHFLFRGELQPGRNGPRDARPVDEYALASRLSYFLWSTMPDEELFAQAAHRTLRRSLDKQVKRMLDDPKSKALVENFAGQWLQLSNLKLASPDAKRFPAFNDALRASMQKETELFFESIRRENRSVLEFLSADYTFLNEKLARLYAIEGVEGEQFRRVSLAGSHRGGLLTQASILTITSNPTRTSPVKRGKWVLENILGSPPPPPPPNVPELKEGKAALTGTLRQRMEQHRADPNCVSCHARMDPIGFGFENFDAIGAWREKEGEFEIDASGQLSSGESFIGPAELKDLLLQRKRDEFIHCLIERILTYALGRGLEYYDKCAVDGITKNLAKANYKFSSLILEIAKSTPFQLRRGESEPTAVATRSER